MERKSELTKALLGEKFKELVAKKGFEKLTIKIITDAAGVIRPTFYTCNGVSAAFVPEIWRRQDLLRKGI